EGGSLHGISSPVNTAGELGADTREVQSGRGSWRLGIGSTKPRMNGLPIVYTLALRRKRRIKKLVLKIDTSVVQPGWGFLISIKEGDMTDASASSVIFHNQGGFDCNFSVQWDGGETDRTNILSIGQTTTLDLKVYQHIPNGQSCWARCYVFGGPNHD